MHVFCVKELGFSDGAAYNRSTESLFEPVARTQSSADPTASLGPAVPVSRQQEHRSVVAPLTEDTFEVRFTGPRALRDKLRQAQDLLRHRVPSGALAVVFDKALDALIVNLKKERFAVGRKPRNAAAPAESTSWSRNIPDAIKRAVYERAQGCCEFVGNEGRRCSETGGLELDHVEGFARTHVHSVEGIPLLCHLHNLLAAEQMYGRAFLDRVRRERKEAKTSTRPPDVARRTQPVCPGASGQQPLF